MRNCICSSRDLFHHGCRCGHLNNSSGAIFEEYEKTYIEKSNWPSGAWDDEVDEKLWLVNELPCFIIRDSDLGYWCGYVGIPKVQFPSLDVSNLSAYGGITGTLFLKRVNHPQNRDRMADYHWPGFDCCHAGDVLPGQPLMFTFISNANLIYRNQDFVMEECRLLATQIIDILNN